MPMPIMHKVGRTLMLLTACGFGLGGCFLRMGATSHSPFETVHDNELTYEDFDDVMDWDAPDDAPIADGIVPVHEFDEDGVAQGGGVKVIDGHTWLTAGDYERNRLLLAAQKNQPDSAVFVIVVATGDVWLVPPGSDNLIESGLIREWHFNEYARLSDYVGQLPKPKLPTLSDYLHATEIVHQDQLPPIHFVHDFGSIGLSDLKSAHGFQILTPTMWNYASPQWRYSELHAFDAFLSQRPEFAAPKSGIAFGVAVPWGTVYAAPKTNYDYLIGTSMKPWTQYQILALPQTPPSTDRPIRNFDDFRLDLHFKP